MFFISKAKNFFIKLRQALIKASILNHFNPKCCIKIEMDVSGHAIDVIFSQLTEDDLG